MVKILAKDNPRSDKLNEEFYKYICSSRDDVADDGLFEEKEVRNKFESELNLRGFDILKEYNKLLKEKKKNEKRIRSLNEKVKRLSEKPVEDSLLKKTMGLLRKHNGQANGRSSTKSRRQAVRKKR